MKRCLARDSEKGAHQSKATAFLKADDIFANRQVGIGNLNGAKARVGAEFAVEHHADAESGGDSFAHGFSRLDVDDRSWNHTGFGEARFENFSRDRSTLADDDVASGKIGHASPPPPRPRV